MKQNTWKLINNAVLETLEGREMMSASPAAATAILRSGILTIDGNQTGGARIQLNSSANGSQIGVQYGSKHATFPANQITQIDITTGSGSDNIYIDPGIDIPADIHSGDGNDIIHGGGGNDTIISGDGNDVIHGADENNVVQAGNGNDKIYGKSGNDTFTVGDGNDQLVGGGGTDVMTSGNGNDTFSAGTGHDTITTGTGHDVVLGGLNNTYLYGKTKTSAGTTTNPAVGTKPTLPTSGATTPGGTTAGAPTGTTNTGGTTKSGTTTTGSTGTTPTTGTTPSTGTGAKGNSGSSTSSDPGVGVTNPGGTVAPTAIISTLAGPRVSGLAINVSALNSTMGEGSVIDANFAWDFGDSSGAHNKLSGFTAAHVYDQAGTYTVTLTITNGSGLVSTTTQQVNVAASTRNQIYVDDSTGSDSNSGTLNSPLRSLNAAFAKMNDNTEILLCAGETFQSNFVLQVNNTNVVIGRYGTGANPTIIRLQENGAGTIQSDPSTNGLTIQDITFDSIYGVSANEAAPKNNVSGVFIGGQNVTVRDCTFLNIDDAINENQNPTGVLIQDNAAPLTTGVRGYFDWVQGAQTTVVGNFAANSTREHIVRAVDFTDINVQDNNFTNLNRQSVDINDTSKGCIEIHRGSYAWVEGNTVTDGDIRIGPLGLFGEAATSQTDFTVIEDNNLTDTFIYVQAGAHDSMIANNVINTDGAEGSYDIVMNGTDAQGRTSSDINIINNTGVNTGTDGNFLRVFGWVNGITLENNLWVAPELTVGDHTTAPVATATNMGIFTKISGNVWPAPTNIPGYAQGGINYVQTASTGNNFLTPAAWNALTPGGTDLFENVQLTGTYQIVTDGLTAGADMKLAA